MTDHGILSPPLMQCSEGSEGAALVDIVVDGGGVGGEDETCVGYQ